MTQKTKYCKFCAATIDFECVVCTKCGKQVEELKGGNDTPIVINNSSSSSSSSSASNSVSRIHYRRRPWHLSWTGIIVIGIFTGGIYWFLGPFMRISWNGRWR